MSSRDLSSLPLPVASLLRRVRNAKSPKERHDSAYFAWEASIRIGVAARPPGDASVLAMPSTGHWVTAGTWADEPLQDAELIEVRALFTELVNGVASRPKGVTARSLLELLSAYRNAVIGHGSSRELAFYERACAVLETGLLVAWDRGVFLPDGARLVYADTVTVDSAGRRRARLVDVSGVATTLIDPAAAVPEHVTSSRLFVRAGDALLSLHPWLVLQESELRDAVLFFNGLKKTAHYLDYVSGESFKAKELAAKHPGLDAEVASALQRAAATESAPEPEGKDRFGDYRILGKLGEGGMGIVYLAQQESLGRLVALKLLPASLSDDAVSVARFRREIAALARCDHPNVVKILASGQLGATHYYAMELIEGADLAEVSRALSTAPDFDSAVSSASERVRKAKPEAFANVAPVPHAPRPELKGSDRVRQIARLFRDAARSVQALHDVGIIHRDIKPANLMVTSADHRVVVMDLGLALLGDASRSLTRDKSSLLGTLRYMPPEQLQRNLLEVDGRADLYALGATFYELFCGRPVFDGDSEARLIEQVLHEVPAPARKVNPELPRDLSLILGKCLEKDARLRYASAEALAQDLDAYLEGRAVSARAPTVGYLLQVAMRRNKPLTVALAALLVLGLTGLVVLQLRESEHKAELRASYARALLEQGRQKLSEGTALQALPFLADAYALYPEDHVTRFLVGRATQQIEAERGNLTLGSNAVMVQPLSRGKAAATLDDRGVLQLWSLESKPAQLSRTLEGQAWIGASPQADRIAAGGKDGTVTTLDSRGGTLRTWKAHEGGVRSIAWAATADLIVTIGASDGRVRRWNADTGAPAGEAALEPAEAEAWTTDLAGVASPVTCDGARMVLVQGDRASLVDLFSGDRVWSPPAGIGSIRGAAISAEGDAVLLTGTRDAALWRTATAELSPVQSDLDLIAFPQLRAGYALLMGGDDARLWSVEKRRPLSPPRRMQERLLAATWVRDRLLATADDAGRVTLWSLPAMRPRDTFEPSLELHGLFASPDGTALAGINGNRVLIWALPPEPVQLGRFEEARTRDESSLRQIAFGADGWTILAWQPRGTEIRRYASGTLTPLRAERDPVWQHVSPDGRTALFVTETAVEARDTATGERVLRVATEGPADGAEVSADRTRLVVVTGGAMELFDGRQGTRLARFERAWAAHFSSNGAQLAAAGQDGCGVFGAKDGLLRKWIASAPADSAIVTNDGRRLICVRSGGGELYDVATGESLGALALPGTPAPFWFELSPNETRILGKAGPRGAAVWNTSNGALTALLAGHQDEVLAGAFDHDGRRIVTAGADGLVRIWETTGGSLLATLPVGGVAKSVRFSPDGRRVAVATDQAQVWPLPYEERPPEQVRVLLDAGPWRLEGGQLLWKTGATPVAKRLDPDAILAAGAEAAAEEDDSRKHATGKPANRQRGSRNDPLAALTGGSAQIYLRPDPEANVSGAFDKELVRKALADHRPQLAACGEEAKLQTQGKLVLRFTILASGEVGPAFVVSDELGSAELERCVLKDLRSWKFPELQTPTILSLPLRF